MSEESIVLQKADLEKSLADHGSELKKIVEDANKEAEARVDGLRDETKAKLDELVQKGQELHEKLADLEQKGVKVAEAEGQDDLASAFIKSDAFKAYAEGRQDACRFEMKTAIVNTYPASTSQPLVQGDRQSGIITNPDRVMRISDLLTHIPTSSNLIEYAKENVFTNSAAPQYGTASPTQIENVAKAESGITFTLATAEVATIAHYIPASRQVLSDSPQLEAFIRQRLSYGLAYEVEDELLNGTGSSGELNGLVNNATAVATSVSGTDTKLDVIRNLITRLQTSEYMSGGAIILNPSDWADIELTKDTDGRYIFGNPATMQAPSLWGKPVVVTNSMTAGQVLVGDFAACGAVYDREQMSIRMSEDHSDNFTKNMVTILAECRLAYAHYRTSALVKASF